jgi:hypothetical protein
MKRHRFLTKISRNMYTFMLIHEGVDRSFGEEVIRSIKKRYPDYETFFRKEYALTSDDLARLRRLCLE